MMLRQRSQQPRALTTLLPEIENKKRIVLPYNRDLCKNVNKIVRKHGLSVAYKNIRSLKRLLGSPKDPIALEDKSGIYAILCNDCAPSSLYFGQTRRKIKTRFKEHLAHFFYDRLGKSSVADHLVDEGHDHENLDLVLLKEINEPRLLNSWESLIISSNRDRALNSDSGPITSILFELIQDLPTNSFKLD